MLEKGSRVTKQIFETQSKGFVTHCYCHSLTLSVKDITKESKILLNAMDTSAEITIRIKYFRFAIITNIAINITD